MSLQALTLCLTFSNEKGINMFLRDYIDHQMYFWFFIPTVIPDTVCNEKNRKFMGIISRKDLQQITNDWQEGTWDVSSKNISGFGEIVSLYVKK